MKKVTIAVGSHRSGKSKTINLHLKPLLGLPPNSRAHQFRLNQQKGNILSQSFEEASYRTASDVIKYLNKYELLVLAARPRNETPSYLDEIATLCAQHGYQVQEVSVSTTMNETQYRDYAQQMFNFLNN